MASTSAGSVSRVPAFRRLLIAESVSWVGTGMTLVALPVLLYQRTSSAVLTALITTLETAPYLLLGLPAGALADRWDRRRVVVVAATANCATAASVPLADLAGVLTIPHLLLVAVLTSSTWVFSDAASFGVVPALVGRDRMAEATSLLASCNTVIVMVAPALGGVLVAGIGAANVLALDALSYLVAGVLLVRLPRLRLGAGSGRLRADITEGLAFLWRHPTIRPLTLAGIGNSLTNGAVLGLLVVFAVRELDLGEDDGRLGLLYAAVAAGGLAASLLLPRVTTRLPVGRIAVLGLAALVAAVVLFGASPSLAVALPALVGCQAATTLVSLNGIVHRQTVTPEGLQSRVNTAARMIAVSGQPLGAALAGVLAELVGVRPTIFLATAGAVVSLVALLASPLSRGRPT